MSTPAETTKGPPESGAESPTTARPLEMDDDDVQETGVLGEDGTPVTTSAATTNAVPTGAPDTGDAPPAKPPRPMTEAQKNHLTLKEAFPSIDDGVIRAVLSASGGSVEPAFNALLEMTDPEAANKEDGPPPPQPPRPQNRGPSQMSQMEADERYARQLERQFNDSGAYEARTSNRGVGRGAGDDDRERNFFDDDLPVIRDNLRKGFTETQTKVSGWITNLRKRMEDNFDENDESQQGSGQYRPPGGPNRRSGDYERYDADPEVLGDDFAGTKLPPDGGYANRTAPNYGAFRGASGSPRPADGRRVNFREDTEEIDMYDASPTVPPKDTPQKSSEKASKWQPLSNIEPSPIGDNDPFSLGDSEDEKDAKDKPKDTKEASEATETKPSGLDETERLKQAAAEAMADSLVDPSKEGEESSLKKS